MSNKKNLGQYYTKQYEKILSGISIPEDIIFIVEPFAGNGDLDKYIREQLKQMGKKPNVDVSIELYDIDPKRDDIIQEDTIMNPPDYMEKYIITNPPYITRNKSTDKTPFDFYGENDLYKCFIRTILSDNMATGGIFILPVNFLICNRKKDIELRRDFLKNYQIKAINMFEERVFNDTTSAVCCIQFIERDSENYNIPIHIYPTNCIVDIQIGPSTNYVIANEIINITFSTKYNIERWTKFTSDSENITNLVVKCLDKANPDIENLDTVIHMEYVEGEEKNKYKDNTAKLSSRTFAVLVITPTINIEAQKRLVNKFNDYLYEMRKKYHSMFLSSYREFARKRISFNLVYKIAGYLLDIDNLKN